MKKGMVCMLIILPVTSTRSLTIRCFTEPARSSIPVEKELKKKRKAELIVICEEHEVDHDGATVKVMIDRLLNNVKRTRLNE